MKDTSSVLDGYLSKHDLARELGCSPRTLDRHHSAGSGPRRTVLFRRVYYSRTAVAAFLERHTEQPVPEPRI